MVAVNNMSFIMEIKDETGTMFGPFEMQTFNVNWRAREPEMPMARDGTLRAGFIGGNSLMFPPINQLESMDMTRFRRFELYVKNEPTARSYNIFCDSFLCSYTYEPLIGDFFLLSTEWRFRDTRAVFNLPRELQQDFRRRNEHRVWPDFTGTIAANRIREKISWAKYGF